VSGKKTLKCYVILMADSPRTHGFFDVTRWLTLQMKKLNHAYYFRLFRNEIAEILLTYHVYLAARR
jgi:hypothetical protein